MVGDIREMVFVQVEQDQGTTANLYSLDLKTEALLQEILPWSEGFANFGMRIGDLMCGMDHWWRAKDPNGPRELADALRLHAEPYFAGRRSLSDQAKCLGRGSPTFGNSLVRMRLALTLYRMGQIDEACQSLRNPSKWAYRNFGKNIDAVRNWLGSPREQA